MPRQHPSQLDSAAAARLKLDDAQTARPHDSHVNFLSRAEAVIALALASVTAAIVFAGLYAKRRMETRADVPPV